VLVHLEGHGREEVFADADVTRTVGWFTTLFPVLLDLGPGGTPGAALTRVKEQLRAIPGRGLGYGLLRWLCEDEEIVRRLAEMPRAELTFNYTGQLDQSLPEAAPFAFAAEPAGAAYSPRAQRAHALDVQAGVRGGRLRARFAYGEGRFPREAIEALAERFLVALRAIAAHCLSPEAGGYTPSDFAKAGLTQEDLGDVLDQLDDEV
jgi:non-ribosomal peptide synthase protein (TIGR01720 family)